MPLISQSYSTPLHRIGHLALDNIAATLHIAEIIRERVRSLVWTCRTQAGTAIDKIDASTLCTTIKASSDRDYYTVEPVNTR